MIKAGAMSIQPTDKELIITSGQEKDFGGEIGTVVTVHQSIHDIDRREGFEIE